MLQQVRVDKVAVAVVTSAVADAIEADVMAATGVAVTAADVVTAAADHVAITVEDRDKKYKRSGIDRNILKTI
jgi:hypothetical protein